MKEYSLRMLCSVLAGVWYLTFVGTNTVRTEPKLNQEDVVSEEPDVYEAVDILKDAAAKYKVDTNLLIAIAACESQLRFNNHNYEDSHPDGTKGSFGLVNFKPTTFDSFAKSAGIKDPDLYSARDQAEAAAWAIKNGLGKSWGAVRNGCVDKYTDGVTASELASWQSIYNKVNKVI